MTAPFQVGDRVRVLAREVPHHCRTPRYIRGKVGEVERVCGAFPDPETLAYGHDGLPERTLYRVRFRQADVWQAYQGADDDQLEIEIYDHWLEAVP